MIRTSKRAVVLLLGFALVAAACGDDDTATTQAATPATVAPATSSTTAAATTTTAAPTSTEPMALTPEQFIADNMIPLPPNTDLLSVEETEDGTMVGMIVDSPPPPNYAALLADSDWEVLDVIFGSETTVAYYEVASFCMVAYASYNGATDPDFWMWMYFYAGLTKDDCLEAASKTISLLSGLGRPS